MWQLKLYFQGVLLLVAVIVVVGFLVPCLLSADDSVTPFIGVIILLAVPPAGWLFYRHVQKVIVQQQVMEKANEEDAKKYGLNSGPRKSRRV